MIIALNWSGISTAITTTAILEENGFHDSRENFHDTLCYEITDPGVWLKSLK
jgi:hypothetical protein